MGRTLNCAYTGLPRSGFMPLRWLSSASGRAMKRRGKAGGKVIKTERRKTFRRRTTTKVIGLRKLSAVDETERIALLEHRLNEALEQQSATSEVLRVISNSPSEIQSVLDGIAAAAARLLDVADADIMRVEGQLMRCVAKHGPSPQWEIGSTRAINRDWVTGRAVVDCKTVHVHDLQAAKVEFPEGAAYAKQYGHRTTLATPLLREGNPIGAFLIRRNYVKPFTNEQIELVRNFAAQAVIAIENARLLNELRESLQQQTATADVLEVISRSAFDLQPVFETVAESAVRLCGSDRTFVFRFDGEVLRCVVAYNAPPDLETFVRQNPIRPGRGSGAGRAALERRTIHIRDVTIDPEYTFKSKDIAPLRTVLTVPILKGDDLLGVILTYRLEVNPFTEKQIALVEAFADQAAIAIENVRLFDAEQRRTAELSEALQQQTATADVLKVISRSTFDLQAVLDTLVESAAQLCEADMASINREKGTAYQQVASYGYSPEYQAYMRDHPISAGRGSVVGRTVMQGRMIHIPDVLADPDYKMTGAAKVGGTRTMLGVPLLREGTPIGVIVLQRKAVRSFTDKQIELVETFADQAVIAIENTRLPGEPHA